MNYPILISLTIGIILGSSISLINNYSLKKSIIREIINIQKNINEIYKLNTNVCIEHLKTAEEILNN